MKKSLLALSLLAAASGSAFAADYTDGDIHKNDYKWMQFNAMYSFGEKPNFYDSNKNHDYLEMEFGGRSGIFDIYGYVDIFNLGSKSSQKKANGTDTEKMFMKFAPRVSLDALTGIDLSFGPVQELYIATLFNWGGNDGVDNANIGLGSDVMVPWLGKVGLNAMAHYEINNKEWDGFHIATNWFKPFYFFENGSFFAYQGYIDYQFGVDDGDNFHSSDGGNMFNGIYWHSDRFALGYGLKYYNDVYAIADTSDIESTGFSHYVAATYKF